MLIAIPSKDRAGKVSTEKVMLGCDCTLFVPASQSADYQNHHARVVAVPDRVRGITATRNHILDYAASQGEKHVVQCDDDAVMFGKFEDTGPGRQLRPFEHIQIPDLLEDMFAMTAAAGTNLFGFQVSYDPRFYREYSPFAFLAVIVGNFMGIIDDGQRFDERLKVKEDYDFALQSLYRHRKVVRMNKYAFHVSHLFDPGGCAAYRTYQMELDAIRVLRKKWGATIIGANPRKPWEVTVRPPLRGI